MNNNKRRESCYGISKMKAESLSGFYNNFLLMIQVFILAHCRTGPLKVYACILTHSREVCGL